MGYICFSAVTERGGKTNVELRIGPNVAAKKLGAIRQSLHREVEVELGEVQLLADACQHSALDDRAVVEGVLDENQVDRFRLARLDARSVSELELGEHLEAEASLQVERLDASVQGFKQARHQGLVDLGPKRKLGAIDAGGVEKESMLHALEG